MKQLNFEVPADIKEYLRVLQVTFGENFDIYLGGGYLRDLYSHRGEPKDLDVFIVPHLDGPLNPKEELREAVRQYKDACDRLNDDVYMCHHLVHGDYFEDMKERGVLKVMMGFCTLCGMESQLIMYNHYLSLEDMTEDFDFTINQVVMTADGRIFCSDMFLADHAEKVIRQTSIYTKQRMRDRLGRMVSKYPSYRVDTTITPEDGKDDPKDKLNRTVSVLE